MAIFKRNRPQHKGKNAPPAPAQGQTQEQTQAQESRGVFAPVQASGNQPAETPAPASEFKPVLSFGTEESPVLASAASAASGASAAPSAPAESGDEVRSELDSISDIFVSSDPAPTHSGASKAAAENVTAAQDRWRARRQKAIEQTKRSKLEAAADVAGDAPIIEPVTPEPTEQPKKKNPRRKPAQPVSLAFADLSGRDDLDPDEINDATDIFGVKYPANFDPSEVRYAGRAIDFSNFSLCTALRWEHIKDASDISGVVFPATFDIDNAVFFGRSLRSCDFSAVYALKWRHIESADDIVAVKYPATFDISNAGFSSRNISGSDFSLVSGLRWEHIQDASDISGIRYPATFDIGSAGFASRDISGSDFSLVSGLRWEHIKDAAAIDGIIYPRDFDFDSADFRGLNIKASDFSRAAAFSFGTIAGATDIRRIKYPECFDTSLARFRGLNISGSNFSRVSSLRWAHIRDASDITRLVYPPQFDIDEADYTDRDIEYSDFSLLPGFNWMSVRLADNREGIIYPASFVEPKSTDDEIQGAMLIFLLNLYNREYRQNLDIEKFYDDIAALYPGIDDVSAAALIDNATARWESPDGRRLVELTARESHIGDKLFMIKLGFKLLYPRHGAELTEKLLREHFSGIFKNRESDRFDRRLADLRQGRYLSAAELSEIGFVPESQQKTELSVPVEDVPENTAPADDAAAETVSEDNAEISSQGTEKPSDDASGEVEGSEASEGEASGEANAEITPASSAASGSKVRSFGYIDPESVKMPEDDGGFEKQLIEAEESLEKGTAEIAEVPDAADASDASDTPEAEQEKPVESATPAEPSDSAEKTAEPSDSTPSPDKYVAKPVDLGRLRQQRAQKKTRQESTAAVSRRERLSDEEKAIRTGVMGMLLYIHNNSSEEELSNASLFSEFMKIYPGAAPKEAAAMAQFASNTLNGTDADTRAKLFMFAGRAPAAVKRKLLDFAYNEYVYKLSETSDEEVFRDFLLTLCDTLYEDSPEYEYSSYLRSRDILKDPPLRREASYRRIPFENNLGKANLYANERYPYYRTLEQLGFQHFTFDAIRGNLLIEVSDSRYYEELQNLVYREKNPNLLQFIIIETQLGYLYLEQRCIDDWQVDERDVWAAAEHNMHSIDLRPKYSFASSEFSSFRYIQHDLASYCLVMPEFLGEMACGQDLILTVPCREIVYIDFYDFGAIRKMLEFSSRYNCTLIINGEEYEHPFSSDVFIYHAADGSFERVNDETYILLGDSVARRQVLRSVLPLNVDFSSDKLVLPRTTDEVPVVTEEQCVVQEAVFTLLKLYAEMNGDNDYTIPENAMMAVSDELFISFDAVYPPARGREQPDPLDHLDEAARMAIKGGKTICWLMIQAIQYLCGDIKYETASSAHIRETLLDTIYGGNANAVWLNCATASDFKKRYESVRPFHEKPVENQHLTILDSRVEVAMHVFTMLFHQFGRRYALSEVRRHLYRCMPDIQFSYEINQSAWLPSPGDDVDVDAQSLGMIFRGFDRSTQERLLTAFADAIGDRDLSEGGWPLLYFIKFVKYAYLDPVEMVERYFVRRSRLIPAQTVLKQLYYKDLTNEFVKHSRTSGHFDDSVQDDAFDIRATAPAPVRSTDELSSMLSSLGNTSFDTPVVLPDPEAPAEAAMQRPDLQLSAIESGYLEKHLSFVLEPVDQHAADSLREAAHYVTKVFHVPEVMFKANDDLECELHYGIIRSRDQITTLRSFAWTLAGYIIETGREMREVTEKDILRTVETVENNNRINYKANSKYFPVLCSMPLDEGMYIPAHQEYIFFAQELLPEAPLASLFTLQNELMQLAPSMKIAYDLLRERKRGDIMPPKGVLFDALCAWSAYSFSAGEAFEVVKGPQMYNYSQIVR